MPYHATILSDGCRSALGALLDEAQAEIRKAMPGAVPADKTALGRALARLESARSLLPRVPAADNGRGVA